MNSCLWVYEVISNETGEVFKVLSYEFLNEFVRKTHYRYVTWVGYFDYQKQYHAC